VRAVGALRGALVVRLVGEDGLLDLVDDVRHVDGVLCCLCLGVGCVSWVERLVEGVGEVWLLFV
jgi:hypothetical protein